MHSLQFDMPGLLLLCLYRVCVFQLASPVQDELGGLARFEIGRIDITGMLNTESDVSLEMRILLQSISLDDIRQHSTLAVKRYLINN